MVDKIADKMCDTKRDHVSKILEELFPVYPDVFSFFFFFGPIKGTFV